MSDLTPIERVEAVKPIANALLPANATPRERALLAAELAILALYEPETIATIWDPWKCPAALLPWLAWALSVDVWSNGWPEETKRKAIAASPMVHRLKGVRGAVRRALVALGVIATVEEWWEKEPIGRRGTFDVTIHADGTGPLLDLSQLTLVRESVRASKPKSRVFDLRLRAEQSGPLPIGVAPLSGSVVTLPPRPFTLMEAAWPARWAAAVLSAITQPLPPKPLTEMLLTGGLFWASAGAPSVVTATLFPRGSDV